MVEAFLFEVLYKKVTEDQRQKKSDTDDSKANGEEKKSKSGRKRSLMQMTKVKIRRRRVTQKKATKKRKKKNLWTLKQAMMKKRKKWTMKRGFFNLQKKTSSRRSLHTDSPFRAWASWRHSQKSEAHIRRHSHRCLSFVSAWAEEHRPVSRLQEEVAWNDGRISEPMLILTPRSAVACSYSMGSHLSRPIMRRFPSIWKLAGLHPWIFAACQWQVGWWWKNVINWTRKWR